MNENRPAARKRLWQSLSVAAAFVVMFLVGQAQASDAARSASLREIAPNVRAFASDGSRYAAWQESKTSPITVLDTTTGQRRSIVPPAGCQLRSAEEHSSASGEAAPNASSGRLLLECGTNGQSVLNVQSGQTQLLPHESTRYEWNSVGALYAENSNYSGCPHFNECTALYNLATGVISVRHTPPFEDLNRPGAPSPALCPAIKRRIYAAEKAEPTPSFVYENGLYVHPVKHTYVEIYRCKRHPILLATHGEPRDFNLNNGLLTWDTGYPSDGVFGEDESRFPSVLTIYQLATGKRRNWRLPERFVPNAEPTRSTLGYSTHNANTIFWIADRSVLVDELDFYEVETFAVYSARFWASRYEVDA
jgi:hypothetical protein